MRSPQTSNVLLIFLAFPLMASAQSGPAQSTEERVEPGPASEPTEVQHYWLRVTGERVNVRSRADANSRIVGRVNRDDVLEGVGSEYGWHRIVPPDGVFSLVATSYVERVDAKRGMVKVDTTLRVRVGSDVMPRDPMLSEVQARLASGTEVQIIGELDAEWLKIVPPAGVCVHISAEFVEVISAEVAGRLRPAKPRAESQPATVVTSRPSSPAEAVATTRPVEQPDLTGRWGKRLGWALDAIATEEQKPGDEQIWDGVLGHLGPIAKQREEPQVAELAAAWLQKIDRRKREQGVAREARELVRQTRVGKARHARKVVQFRHAKDELKPRPEFDARGVLRPSFAMGAGPYGMRYKVQDPFTRKVQAYVEFPTELGIEVQAAIGKYVGVRGEKQSVEGVGVPLLRVTRLTVLNPDKPKSPPAREKP
jgi:hypothetical protein